MRADSHGKKVHLDVTKLAPWERGPHFLCTRPVLLEGLAVSHTGPLWQGSQSREGVGRGCCRAVWWREAPCPGDTGEHSGSAHATSVT